MLQKFGTVVSYRRPLCPGDYEISVLVFSDANRQDSNGQLGFICGLLVGPFSVGSLFHTISWSSKKSKRPVRSIGSAETIAAGVAIDEGKLLVMSLKLLLGIHVDLRVCVDSKDLWDTLTTCHEPTDKSVRADVNVIRYEFETHKVNFMSWIPGKLNMSDPLTKKDSPMNKSLQLMMFSGELPVSYEDAKTRKSEQSTG